MKILKKWKDSWNAYIKRLGESNSKTYGQEPMSCCSVNRKMNGGNGRNGVNGGDENAPRQN